MNSIIRFSIVVISFIGQVLAAPVAGPTLKGAYREHFRMGAALNEKQFTKPGTAATPVVVKHFNTITPENVMKWESLQPQPGQFRFEASDAYVNFGEKHRMFVVGHTLVWHQQTPDWVFKAADGSPLNREQLLERMRTHIHTVVGRYKGRIKGWDVVNEAIEEDGSLRGSAWKSIIGDDFIQKAFEYAHEADPAAELYYNDYCLENPAKRQGAVALINRLKQAGVNIHGVGIQEHVNLNWPSLSELENTITAFGALGVKVMITELDVDMLAGTGQDGNADISRRETGTNGDQPKTKTLPDELQQKLAARYRDLFGVYLKHRNVISRVTFWGVGDGDSWLNHWPTPGRTNHPLLFDREYRPKPAFDAVLDAAKSVRGN